MDNNAEVEELDIGLEQAVSIDHYRESMTQVNKDGELSFATNGHILAVRRKPNKDNGKFHDWIAATHFRPGRTVRIALDAKLLCDLASAICPIRTECDEVGETISYTRDHRVILEINPDEPLDIIAVRPASYFGTKSAGAIMPIRFDEKDKSPREVLTELASLKSTSLKANE